MHLFYLIVNYLITDTRYAYCCQISYTTQSLLSMSCQYFNTARVSRRSRSAMSHLISQGISCDKYARNAFFEKLCGLKVKRVPGSTGKAAVDKRRWYTSGEFMRQDVTADYRTGPFFV